MENYAMSYNIDSAHMFFEEDEFLTMICFADDMNAPSKSVILQNSKEYDEQDRKLGMDKIHIQIEDQSRSLYGGIKQVSKNGEFISIELEDSAYDALNIDGDIRIEIDESQHNANAIVTSLKAMVESNSIPFSQD